MFRSTLPTWLVVLIFGAIVNFFLGFLNPFLSERSKRRMKQFGRKNQFYSSKILVVIQLRYHFSRSVYMVFAIIAWFVAFLIFTVERFNYPSDKIGCGIFEVTCMYIASALIEGFIVVISLALERFRATMIAKYYKWRYGAKVVTDY